MMMKVSSLSYRALTRTGINQHLQLPKELYLCGSDKTVKPSGYSQIRFVDD